MPDQPSRDEAFALLTEYVKDPGLVRHMLSVRVMSTWPQPHPRRR
jgi:predicted hydrolase (HD superfamily)